MDLFVIETENDRLLGTVDLHPDGLVVHSGLVGRPPVIRLEEIVAVTPAVRHPDVVAV